MRTLLAFATLAATLAFPPEGLAEFVDPPNLLEIHVLDVRQGAALFVIGPGAGGKTLLLDSGNRSRGADVAAYLKDNLGIDPPAAIDYTLMSHMHADHIGGFDEIVGDAPDRYQVSATGANLCNGGPDPGSAQYDQYMAAATATNGGVPVAVTIDDPVLQLGDGAYLKILAVNGKLVNGTQYPVSHPNERSVSALIRYGSFEFIWSGDLEGFDITDNDGWCTGRSPSSSHEDLETPLANALVAMPTPILDPSVGVDVLHVNHHGSDTSTNAHWMNVLRPEVALISVGENGHKHPKISVVENVLMAAATCVSAPAALVLQTREGDTDPTADASKAGHVVGHIVIKTDGNLFDIKGEGAAVDPDESHKADLPATWLTDDLAPDCSYMVLKLGGLTVDSPTVWRAKHSIETTGPFSVVAGGEVVLHAGARVALGNEFSVGAVGELVVEIEPLTDCSDPEV